VDVEVGRNLDTQSQIIRAWWEKWSDSYWQLLAPRSKWTQEHRDVRVGDIGCLAYNNKVGPPAYRMCRVVEVLKGRDSKVRTVDVILGKKNSVIRSTSRKSAALPRLRVGIARIANILPTEEEEILLQKEVEKDTEASDAGAGAIEEEENLTVAVKGPSEDAEVFQVDCLRMLFSNGVRHTDDSTEEEAEHETIEAGQEEEEL
jgi:hypothetical protein